MDLVKIERGQVLADSLTIATAFGKQHKHVIRDIEVLIANMKVLEEIEDSSTLSKIGEGTQPKFGLGYSTEQIQRFFIESKYYHPKNKQEYKMYLMTRDGFSLLVMGFTGQKALEWKLKYIEAFNYMRESLNRVRDLSILDSKELEKIKGSARSIIHIEKQLRDDMKEMEKIIRRIGDRNTHLYAYGTQILDMSKNIEQGKLRGRNEY